MMRAAVFVAVLTLFLPCQNAQQTASQDHNDHQSGVTARGDHAMGFSHESTTHHFRLFNNGGEIVVEANDPKDLATRDQIRSHLSHVAMKFSAGNFDLPMFIHDTTPPGVSTMKQLRDQIRYNLFETDRGARVRITAASTQGIDAVHAFLLFQIVDHQTGDSPAISEETQAQ